MADITEQLKRSLNGAKIPAAAIFFCGIVLLVISLGVAHFLNQNKETLNTNAAILIVLAAQVLGMALNAIILGWSGYRAVKRGFSILESAGVGALSAAIGSLSYSVVATMASIAFAGAIFSSAAAAGVLSALIGAAIWVVAGTMFAAAGAFYAQGK